MKHRIRSKSNAKKKWKKGHSSDSNPKHHSHRDLAKNKFFSVQSGQSNLTVEALAKHDATQLGHADRDIRGDSQSIGSNDGKSFGTFNTFASNWTDCTNATFSRVHRHWGANATAYHKETLAVLAAVTEVIKTQGGIENETTYFAALMTALESTESELTLSATTYLISLAIKKVPSPVLKTRFADVSKKFMDLLVSHSTTDVSMLLRHLLVCVAHLLRVQDRSVWSYSSTTQMYNSLLAFTIHTKPKVRKAAQEAVRVIIKASMFMTSSGDDDNASLLEHHPAAAVTAKFCVQQIEKSGGGSDSVVTLHILGLLHHILAVFPLKSLKLTCETILKVMTLANVLVNSTSFKTLNAMFVAHLKKSTLSAGLNAQLITALYDYQPSENDSQLMSAWLAVMESAHLNLYRLSTELCLSHVPKLFSECMRCLRNNNPGLCRVAAKTAKTLLRECMAGSIDALTSQLTRLGEQSVLLRVFRAAEAGLSYQYHAAWDHVLHVLATVFDVAGKQCAHVMKKCLLSLADLRDSHRFAYQHELDSAFSVAVTRMGPSQVLSAVPLQITGENDNMDFPRSWLLPLMRQSVKDTELGFFASYFLPLASKLRTKAVEHAARNEVLQARTYDTLQLQIWSLLPGFCTNPTDFDTSFKELARYLGMALSDRDDLQSDVMLALRKLLKQSTDNDTMKVELARYAKNYLPILFNLYCKKPENEQDKKRNAYLATVIAYLPVTQQELIDSYFDRCMAKLQEKATSGFKQYAYFDLNIAMVSYLDVDRISTIYNWLMEHIQAKDLTLQKKCYKCLRDICAMTSDASRQFVRNNLERIQKHLVTSLSATNDAAKAFRLGCLIHIFKQLETEEKNFLISVIPEAVLCVQAKSSRARKFALELLTEMARTAIRWADNNERVALEEYTEFVLAGLQESKQMMPCVMLALRELVVVFKEFMAPSTINDIVTHACNLLSSTGMREVITACFSLLRKVMAKSRDTEFAPHLQPLVSNIVAMKPENKRHFRKHIKVVFEKLIKKFGYKPIVDMVPEEHHKQLKNIHKTSERLKRRKCQRSSGADDEDDGRTLYDDMTVTSAPTVKGIDELLQDSDSDDDDDTASKRSNRSKRGAKNSSSSTAAARKDKAWLQEGNDGDIVDFLDPSVSKKVLGTKPGASKMASQRVKHDFKTSSDGRLIIRDDKDDDSDDDDAKTAKRKAAKRKHADDEDDLNELLDALSGHNIGKKKKKSAAGDTADDDGDAGPAAETKSQASTSGYKPGGRGIHRPIKGSDKVGDKSVKKAGFEYRAKKAGGDIKKKGKPDPYAFIPLETRLLNRRKRKKAAGQFKSMITGAKKGANKGKKQRSQKGKLKR